MKKKEYKFPKAKAIKLQESILNNTSDVSTDSDLGAHNDCGEDDY